MIKKNIDSIPWPNATKFAFTVFDDTDSQSLERGKPVYDYLVDLGFRTTKSVWVNRNHDQTDKSGTCDDPEYLQWLWSLQKQGFEIAWHMAGATTSSRTQTIKGLEKFKGLFGHYPQSMANHYECKENIYFGDWRVSGLNRFWYNIFTRYRNHNQFKGQTKGDALFWGDCCRSNIQYVRNFVFGDINTLKVCSQMPYHDPERGYVQNWFAASEGANVRSFNKMVTRLNLDRLEREGGACIMYTHFGLGFYDEKVGRLNNQFTETMKYLASRNVWLPTVTELLDFLLQFRGQKVLSKSERAILELKWLFHKIAFGSS